MNIDGMILILRLLRISAEPQMQKQIHILEILGHQNTYFLMRNLIFGPKFSYLVFEAVNVWGFWGPEETRVNQNIKIKVIPSIFKKFWSRNNLDKLDQLNPQVK